MFCSYWVAVLTTYSLPAFSQSISASDMLARWDSPDASMPAPRKFDPATLLRQDKGGFLEGRVAGEALAVEISTRDQFLLGIPMLPIGLFTFGIVPAIVYKRQKPSSMTAEAMAKYADENDLYLIFCRQDGTPLDPDTVSKIEFHRILKSAGIRRIRFHDLRHTYASLLVAQGESPKYIQCQLGHSSIQVTLDRYGHLMPDVNEAAAARLEDQVFGPPIRKLLEIGA